MKQKESIGSRYARIGAAVLLGAAFLMTTTAAQADPGRGDTRHHEVRRHGGHGAPVAKRGQQHVHRNKVVRRTQPRYRHECATCTYRAPRTYHRRPVVVPSRIVYRAPDYDAFFWGRAYHRAHGHDHIVYRFPVRVAGGVDYRAYAYCDGRLHSSGTFTLSGPRFDLRVSF